MKVTARITADNGGERWTAKFPDVDADECFPVVAGTLTADVGECYCALAFSPYVQGVKASEPFLNQIVASWAIMVNNWKSGNCIDADAKAHERTMAHVEARDRRGMQTYAVAVWHQRKGNVVSLSMRTDKRNVYERRDFERFFAWKMAEAARVVSGDLVDRGLPPIEMDAETLALLAEFDAWCAERKAEGGER